MSKRPSLRESVVPAQGEAAQAVAATLELQRRQEPPVVREDEVGTTATIHLPADLLNMLRIAAMRRSMRPISGLRGDGKSTRPSVSEMVVEMLTRHRAELDAME